MFFSFCDIVSIWISIQIDTDEILRKSFFFVKLIIFVDQSNDFGRPIWIQIRLKLGESDDRRETEYTLNDGILTKNILSNRFVVSSRIFSRSDRTWPCEIHLNMKFIRNGIQKSCSWFFFARSFHIRLILILCTCFYYVSDIERASNNCGTIDGPYRENNGLYT